MTKSELMNLVLPEGWEGQVDTAVPCDWFQKLTESKKELGFKEEINPSFSVVWSYLEEHGSRNFGAPVDLLELLVKKISNGELKVLPSDKYLKLLQNSELLETAGKP